MKKHLTTNFLALACLTSVAVNAQVITGPSSSKAPYQLPVAGTTGIGVTSILTVGDAVNGYKMAGIPDGIGAFDNNDGTFTVVMNHEHGNTAGATRAHGSKGAFVSKWVIEKGTFKVLSGSDLMQKLHLWNAGTSSYVTYYTTVPFTTGLSRFCSADLPAVSAFYNANTGKGTMARIFMNGEENGADGRPMAHVVTGPEAGNSYELPYLGKASWENQLACPRMSDTTVVIGTDDATPGQLYVYLGTKKTSGKEIDKAGLTGGKLYGVAVKNLINESNGIVIKDSVFTLVPIGSGDVSAMAGSAIETASDNAGVTEFLRPEDGAWDPVNPTDFYFLTTNGITSPSRLYRLRFTTPGDFTKGGTITALLDGTEGQRMMDNLGMDHWGNLLIQEDVGNNAHLGKTLQYNVNTGSFKSLLVHDTTLFTNNTAVFPNYITQDEEASGIIDMQEILGAGWFIGTDQIHVGMPGELVEGGQFFAYYNPDTYNANPEISLIGNSTLIPNNSSLPSTANNTDFGNVIKTKKATKTFYVKNAGPAALKVLGMTVTGTNAAEFTILAAPAFPLSIAAGDSQKVDIEFAPTSVGLRKATLNVASNDFDESKFVTSLQGVALDNTGVASLPDGSSMKLFPNPAKDQVVVSVTLKNADNIAVNLLDANGRLVLSTTEQQYQAGEQKITLSTDMLPNGTYYVQVAVGNAITRTKLVVMH